MLIYGGRSANVVAVEIVSMAALWGLLAILVVPMLPSSSSAAPTPRRTAARESAPARTVDATMEGVDGDAAPPRSSAPGADAVLATVLGSTVQHQGPVPSFTPPAPPAVQDAEHEVAAARAFLADASRTDGIAVVEPRGLWRSTYAPRAPRRHRRALDPDAMRLDDAAHGAPLPLDPPSRAALSLQLQADRRAVAGPSRVLVQVGLRSDERRPGRRSAMTVVLVLDLRGHVPADQAEIERELALALAGAEDLGDRFHLVVAGRAGGLVLAPGSYTYGAARVAMERLLHDGPASGEVLDLPAALAAAVDIASSATSRRKRGGRLVLLASREPLGALEPALERQARRGALTGVTVSTVALGRGADATVLGRLAEAGEGRFATLLAPLDAPRTLMTELGDAGQVVARGVRITVRLAPGVALVGLPGTTRLQATDGAIAPGVDALQVARGLGISLSDRPADGGIQLIIPSFLAGDRHAQLLDVLVPGPGTVAEATVEYQDLAWTGDGIARASLALPRGDADRGPLENGVFKSLVAVRLAESLAWSAARLDEGKSTEAEGALASAGAILEGLPLVVPGMQGDADLADDAALVEGYRHWLGSGGATPAVAASLRRAAQAKLRPGPA